MTLESVILAVSAPALVLLFYIAKALLAIQGALAVHHERVEFRLLKIEHAADATNSHLYEFRNETRRREA